LQTDYPKLITMLLELQQLEVHENFLEEMVILNPFPYSLLVAIPHSRFYARDMDFEMTD